eukprot:scaffold54315_cov31-Tisochrysis_lutea.AAC.4
MKEISNLRASVLTPNLPTTSQPSTEMEVVLGHKSKSRTCNLMAHEFHTSFDCTSTTNARGQKPLSYLQHGSTGVPIHESASHDQTVVAVDLPQEHDLSSSTWTCLLPARLVPSPYSRHATSKR